MSFDIFYSVEIYTERSIFALEFFKEHVCLYSQRFAWNNIIESGSKAPGQKRPDKSLPDKTPLTISPL